MAQYFVMLLSSFPFLLLVLLVFSFLWPFVVVHFIFATFEFANFGEEQNENWIGLRNTKARKKKLVGIQSHLERCARAMRKVCDFNFNF